MRAAADPKRVAVAMSGGVDSAVALLKAGPDAVGVTLRLWLDPLGPDAERACCSPAAVIAARETCHSRGLPHVTLDLREEFRRAVVEPFVRGYARGETPNPCIACNGGFRFAELLAFARRVGAGRLATGHYARIAERDGLRLLARASDAEKDQSYMLARVDPRVLDRALVPARRADQGAHSRRGRSRRAGSSPAGQRVRRPASSPATTIGASSSGRDSSRVREASSTRVGGRSAGTTATGSSQPDSGAGSESQRQSPCTRSDSDARTNTVVVGSRAALARTRVVARGRLYASATRVEAKLRYRSAAVAGTVEPTPRGFELHLDEPVYGVARGQAAVLYADDAVVGYGLITSADAV